MKILSTISLFIFGVVVVSILTAGLVFYQNNKTNQVSNSQTGSKVADTLNQLTASGKSIVLNMTEISKHNSQSSCWILINGKIYDVTSYFGSHPGGNSTMAATCGTDATVAYATRDPYASSAVGGSGHSSSAKNLLNDYYIGDLNQTIGQVTLPEINSTIPSVNNVISNTTNNPTTPKAVLPSVTPSGNISLNMTEISKHNKASDCWFIVSNKVYNITSFFGSHPGGSAVMAATCGTDATVAYMTQNPNASSSAGSSAHSSRATNMLSSYFIGNFNQVIGQQAVAQTNSVVAPTSNNGNDSEEDD
ncbi:MAG: hypothetical protein NTU81_01085 [Candidatus Nomurabacteria bacterium]|nr:hypothetical protein [Candidatus Nomurabacteria bacterium]